MSNRSPEHLVITAPPPFPLLQLTISTSATYTCIQPEKGRKIIQHSILFSLQPMSWLVKHLLHDAMDVLS